uniref:C2 domain-containing protein n=1 Tax=Angiostrongylus cantonensis TaxID=6313 RepID=A0A158P928_ANGCA
MYLELTMSWRSYVAPIVGSAFVSTLAFLLGALGFSFIWIGLIVVLNVTKSYLWKKRERRLLALRATATREREVVMAQLQDLPAWVQFPDTERVEWLNKAQMPAVFKNFKFTKMDMGDIPCRVGGIKVYTTNVGKDRIIVDMEVAYAGDADFTVSCCGFTGGMNNLQFSGKLRAVLMPLLPYPPMVGGVVGSFLEMPKIDFSLTGMGEMGVIRLKIIEAKNLENRDISFIRKGKSDPYCEIQVGSQFLKTRTIDNNLNPVWNEYFEAVVDQAHGQKLRIELFDEDQGKDEELGRLSIELKDIQNRGQVDSWFPLEGCQHGDLHLKATWMNLSKDRLHLEKQEWETEWLQADKPIHPALIMVFVDSVADLPPSPFVEVTLGINSQRTPVKVKTVNPLYHSKFLFFVRHPAGQELKFEAVDDGTRRSLGSFTMPLSQLMKEPNLEYYQQTFMLTLGVHQSPIVLTVKLRALTRGDQKPMDDGILDDDTLMQYANASHIERGGRQEEVKAKTVNGDSIAVEPAKTVNPSAGVLDPEIKLNAQEITMLRSDSNSSVNTSSGRSTRLARMFQPKHEKSSKIRGNLPRGDVEMSIRYADDTRKLVVQVLRARQLLPWGKAGYCNPYAVVKLIVIETNKELQKRKTGVVKGSLSPVFDNQCLGLKV